MQGMTTNCLNEKRVKVDRICVIGAGPSGLAAAKYLRAEKAFSAIDIYEQRSNVGGLWQYTPETEGDGAFHIPQTDPHVGLEQPLWDSKVVERNESEYPVFLSPVYEHLETNIPRSLMAFSDAFWADECQLFPRHEVVQKYLQGYAQDVVSMIHFATQVQDVRLTPTDDWSVSLLDLRTKQRKVEIYDAVIVATGHYNTPYIPSIPGLTEWAAAHPGSISHSKYYREPSVYRGKKVAVIGNGPSGIDISHSLTAFCMAPLLLSGKSANPVAASITDPHIAQVPAITHMTASTRTLHFSDGRAEPSVDALLFCTGYLYTAPALAPLAPPPIASGAHVAHTYKHVFYGAAPTLAFVGLPQRVVPFPLAEAQAAVVARVYSGRLALPPRAELCSWDCDRRTRLGPADLARFHDLPFPEDALYINEFVDWAAKAQRRDGLENDGVGKTPKRWGDREFWMRARFGAIKGAFMAKGSERVHVRTVEELGFVFEGAGDEKDKIDQEAQAVRS